VKPRFSWCALAAGLLAVAPRVEAQQVPVIPAPLYAASADGEWRPGPSVTVTVSDAAHPELGELAALAAGIAREALGVRSAVGGGPARRPGGVHLALADVSESPRQPWHHVSIDARGAEVRGETPEAIFHGLQTLRQLLAASPRTTAGGARVAAVEIVDRPRFVWRGLHLDVGRHFQPVAFIKRYIDLMARYKLNTFHWHLTEDQGWRIEIKAYPRLTEVASCRDETMVEKRFDPYVGDRMPHCGFYTQDEIRDVVAYARARHVTVVPEIEMPGHTVAALAAYPELACTPGPFKVRTTWGVDENILCPGERTFTFLETVLTEVMALFPSTFIHIGGDEAPKQRWKESALAQDVIRREGLTDEHALQSWFIARIERFLNANGRRLIGWDEILEGGLAPNATVMSWRGTSGGIEAARQGHDVVMTPTSHLYFDYYQGDERFEPLAIGGLLPLEQVYGYEPVPDELTARESQHVLGAQGNVWTEYLRTPESVEYMAWPRALALAEVAWSAPERRTWDSFLARLPHALRALDALGVRYRLPHVDGLDADVLTLEASVPVRLRTAIPEAVIHYTLDGSDPTPASPRYGESLTVGTTMDGVRVTARAFTPGGRASPPRAATFRRTTFREAVQLPAHALAEGLRYGYYEVAVRGVAALDTIAPVRSGVTGAMARLGDERLEQYGLRFAGFLRVPEDALYTFGLTSDDGSTFAIGDAVVVDHDGPHGPSERTGMVALRAGLHPVTVRFFQAGGGAALSLRYRIRDGAWAPVPTNWLWHER
jgi:hexosaminidase